MSNDNISKILQMLEDGKINVDESVKLIEALQNPTYRDDEYYEDKFNKFSTNAENFANEIGDKVNGAWRGVEPKVKNATKTILDRTARVFDDITKALNDAVNNIKVNEDECSCGGNCNCQEEEPKEQKTNDSNEN